MRPPNITNIIAAWLWLVYPALVVGVVLLSVSYLVSGSPSTWQRLMDRKNQVEQNAIRAAKLTNRLNKLRAVDPQVEKENLDSLLAVVPSTRQFATLLFEVQAAASQANTVIIGYKGTAGDLAATESAQAGGASDQLALTFSFTVEEAQKLADLLLDLESRVPLVRVQSVRFSTPSAQIVVEGVWIPLARLSPSDEPLPDLAPLLGGIRQKTEALTRLPPAVFEVDQETNPNPF